MTIRLGACAQSRNEETASCCELVLLRHAQAALHGRFCGYSDPELSEEGRKAIAAIISRLGETPPSAICCSDLLRAEQTATPIAEHFALTCQLSTALREMNFGLWEGLSWKEVKTQFPEDARSWVRCFPHHQPPGGESFLKFQARVIAELERLSEDAESGSTLVVTHAGFIRAAIAWVLRMPDDQISRVAVDYGAAIVLRKTGGHWMLVAGNVGEAVLCPCKEARA